MIPCGAELAGRLDVLDRLVRRQTVGADPGPYGTIPGDLPGAGDLLGEAGRFLRVGHRAQSIDDPVVEPGAPILQLARQGVSLVGRSRHAHDRLRTLRSSPRPGDGP